MSCGIVYATSQYVKPFVKRLGAVDGEAATDPKGDLSDAAEPHCLVGRGPPDPALFSIEGLRDGNWGAACLPTSRRVLRDNLSLSVPRSQIIADTRRDPRDASRHAGAIPAASIFVDASQFITKNTTRGTGLMTAAVISRHRRNRPSQRKCHRRESRRRMGKKRGNERWLCRLTNDERNPVTHKEPSSRTLEAFSCPSVRVSAT
jgi:hypothetical protein